MRHEDSDPVTWGDLRRVYKKLDTRIDETFDKINQNDENQAGFWDEHEEKIKRILRAIKRLGDSA